jgi:hypothetical protein
MDVTHIDAPRPSEAAKALKLVGRVVKQTTLSTTI